MQLYYFKLHLTLLLVLFLFNLRQKQAHRNHTSTNRKANMIGFEDSVVVLAKVIYILMHDLNSSLFSIIAI